MKPYSFFNASIETFLLAAKHRSFRKTAETLGLSAPAVSRSMKHLEEELGFELFVRERPLALTSEGERLKAILEGAGGPIAKEIEALRNTSFVKPSVSIGLPESFNLLHGRELIEVLKPYCSHIQLVSSGSSDVLTEQMNAGHLDIILAPDNHQLLGTIKKIPVDKQTPLIIFPKGKAPHGKALTWDEIRLSGLPLIGYARCNQFQIVIRNLAQEQSLPLQTLFEVDSNAVLFGLVAAGQGWGFTYPMSIESLPHLAEQLAFVEPPTQLPERELFVIYASDALSAVADVLAAFVKDKQKL